MGETSRASRAERRAAERRITNPRRWRKRTAFESEQLLSRDGLTHHHHRGRASADSGRCPSRASRVSLDAPGRPRRPRPFASSDVSPRARRAPPRGGDARGPPRVRVRGVARRGRRARVGGRGAFLRARRRAVARAPSRSARAQVRARVPLAPRRPRDAPRRGRDVAGVRGGVPGARERDLRPRRDPPRGVGAVERAPPRDRTLRIRGAAPGNPPRRPRARDRRARRRGPKRARGGGRRRGTRRVVDGG